MCLVAILLSPSLRAPSPRFLAAEQVVVKVVEAAAAAVPRGSRRASRMSPARVAALCVADDVTPRPRCYWLGVKGKVHLLGTEDTALGEVTATSGLPRRSHSPLESDPSPPEAWRFAGPA